MALQGPIPVDFALVFPDGVYAAGVFEPVRDFDASANGRFVQSKDKATGLPLWTVEVIDADKEARTRTVKVKVAAPHQPVLPASPPGVPFVAVEFAGLTVTPYVNQSGKLGYSRRPASAPPPKAARPVVTAPKERRQQHEQQRRLVLQLQPVPRHRQLGQLPPLRRQDAHPRHRRRGLLGHDIPRWPGSYRRGGRVRAGACAQGPGLRRRDRTTPRGTTGQRRHQRC
jgi:hypothetical protein